MDRIDFDHKDLSQMDIYEKVDRVRQWQASNKTKWPWGKIAMRLKIKQSAISQATHIDRHELLLDRILKVIIREEAKRAQL